RRYGPSTTYALRLSDRQRRCCVQLWRLLASHGRSAEPRMRSERARLKEQRWKSVSETSCETSTKTKYGCVQGDCPQTVTERRGRAVTVPLSRVSMCCLHTEQSRQTARGDNGAALARESLRSGVWKAEPNCSG